MGLENRFQINSASKTNMAGEDPSWNTQGREMAEGLETRWLDVRFDGDRAADHDKYLTPTSRNVQKQGVDIDPIARLSGIQDPTRKTKRETMGEMPRCATRVILSEL